MTLVPTRRRRHRAVAHSGAGIPTLLAAVAGFLLEEGDLDRVGHQLFHRMPLQLMLVAPLGLEGPRRGCGEPGMIILVHPLGNGPL